MPHKPFEPTKRFTDAALAVSDDCIKIIGLDGSLQYMSEGGQRVMEVDDFARLRGCPWPDFWQGQGNIDAVAAIHEARAGRSARFLGFANTAKGRRRFWDVRVSPILAEDGSVESILSVSRDITELKEFEEQQLLLRHELSHRIKNILALVQAVASQTLKEGVEMKDAKQAFAARLTALGKAHELLVNEQYTSSHLGDIVKAIGEDFAGRIVGTGPAVVLSSKSSLAVALALHELATNAIKYGALSSVTGQVAIDWSVQQAGGEDQLSLVWTERGGPAVSRPTRKGFGSLMIERALTGYVGGDAIVDYQPSGLVFRLNASISALATTE